MTIGITNGNTFGSYIVSLTINPASVAAATSAEQTFTLPGLKLGDTVFVNKPTATAGVGIVGARVSAADTLALTFMNATAAPVDPVSEVYSVIILRPEAGVASTRISD